MRRAIVTGGAGAIGSAIASKLHADGFEIVITHLGQQQQAEQLAAQLGINITIVESDTSDASAVEKLHHDYPADILVHCAGITGDAAIWKQDVEQFDAVHAVSLRGAWLQTRHASSNMRQNKFGRIIYIGSINGSRGKFGQTAYASAKAGLHGLMKSAAKELGSRNITVNIIEPGWIDTPMTLALDDKYRDAALAESLVNELGTPQDIAASVAFLCSDSAKQITANIIRVDGGQII
ncbi:MAG: SDR family oxidoreductase [Planctomycetes bacterium]|nr:SDR family oxidoreductase [Planctomycetota bacterium]